MKKVVFLDRDGVINERAPEHKHILKFDDFKMINGVESAIRSLNERGYIVVVVTNQSCISRGTATLEQIEDVNKKMQKNLRSNNAVIDFVLMCPHDDKDMCDCRKPKVGLFLQAEALVKNIDKENSYMIGDSSSDIKAGQKFGIKTIAIGEIECESDYQCKNLIEASRIITGG